MTTPVDSSARRAGARRSLVSAVATLLTATALRPAFDSAGWLPYVLLAVTTVGVLGWAARRLGLPGGVPTLVQLAGLLLLVIALFAPGPALLGFLPTPDAVGALHALVDQGRGDIAQLAPPVHAGAGLELITTVGVGLVAILVDGATAGLRRAPLAGIPLLALYAVPAAVVSGGVGWVPFALGAAGYVGLLLVEGRDQVGRWGQPLGAPASGGSLPGAVGRRIGATALALAVIVPALVPGLPGRPLGKSGGLTGSGSHSVTTYNPFLALRADLHESAPQTLVTVQTDDPSPGYLRMTVLDRYDGTTWSQLPLQADGTQRIQLGLPPPQGVNADVPAKRFGATLQVSDGLDVPWLPVYNPVVGVSADGDWRYDASTRTIFSTHATSRGLRYALTGEQLALTPAALEVFSQGTSVDVSRDLELPANVPAPIRTAAAAATRGARTPYERAVLLQHYFRDGQFVYDEKVSTGSSGNALVDFLKGRHGYCEQFAAAMALMARVEHIPARVAIGFTQGNQQGTHWTITTRDAHAWPELFFAGAGWVPFEPTPRGPVDGQTITPAYSLIGNALRGQAPAPGGSLGEGNTQNAPSPGTGAKPSPRPQPAPATSGGTGGGPGRLPLPLPALVALAVVVIAVLSPAAGRKLARRRRWGGARDDAACAHAAWAEIADDAADVGLALADSQSPRAAAHRLIERARLDPLAAATLQEVAYAEERARYARRAVTSEELPAAVRVVRHGLRRAVPLGRRVRGTVFAPSVLGRARRTAVASYDRLAGRLAGWLASRLPSGLRGSRRRLARRRLPEVPQGS